MSCSCGSSPSNARPLYSSSASSGNSSAALNRALWSHRTFTYQRALRSLMVKRASVPAKAGIVRHRVKVDDETFRALWWIAGPNQTIGEVVAQLVREFIRNNQEAP
jgi:hypothetical protein